MTNDYGLLSIQYRTLFLTSPSGRIEQENDPDRSPGPRLWLAGCASGNVSGIRFDVPDDVAAEIAALIATEPPFVACQRPPIHLDSYITLLSRDTLAPRPSFGVIYELPNGLWDRGDVTLIASGTRESQQLEASFSSRGIPDQIAELGFRSVSDFWPPWCMALLDDQVVSVAFAARLSDAGAELGIVTVPAFRGKGYAAAATAGWSRSRALRSRALFYSTDQTNTSSQRVTARLGLRCVGASLRLI